MGFDREPTGYEKTILSDLQGAWQCLRVEVADNPGFTHWDRVLLHIDEAMSWESVRNLRQMNRALLLVRKLIQQSDASDEIKECLISVDELMIDLLDFEDDHLFEFYGSGDGWRRHHVLVEAETCGGAKYVA